MSGVRALSEQIQATYNRLLQLQQRASGDATQNSLLAETMAELSATLEELEVTAEELSQQNKELLSTRQVLETERQRYQSLFAFAPDAYLVTDDQGIIQLGNRAAERLLQVRREHLVGKPLILFIAEADHRFVYAQLDEIARVLQSRPGVAPSPLLQLRPANHPATVFLQDQEVTVQPRQQPEFPASLALSAEANCQGQVRLYWVFRDLRERKQLETTLQESETRYRLLTEMSPLGIFRYDSTGRCTYVNERALQLVDRPIEACLGLNWIETIYPDDRERVSIALQTFMTEATAQPDAIHQVECRYLRSDGQLVWVWVQIAAERDPTGTITGYIGTLTNITERKQLESDLQLSEEQLRLALDLNQIGSWDWHPTTATTNWNDHNYRLLGYELGAVEPSYECWRDRVDPDDWAEVERRLTEALVTQTDCEIEYRIVWPDGNIRWLFSKGRGVYSETGLLLRMMGVAFDITERKCRETNADFLAELMADFAELSTVEEIMQVVSRRTVDHFKLSRCLFVHINTAADEANVVYDWSVSDLPSLVGVYRLSDFHSEADQQQMAAGKPLVIADTTTVSLGSSTTERFSQLQVGAIVNAPFLSNGQWKFVLSAMQTEARQWRNDEVELLQELSARIWLRLERAHVETALQVSEEQRRLALDLTGTATWDWDLTTGNLVWSENTFSLLGLTPGSEPLTYAFWQTCVVPEDLERLEAEIPIALQNRILFTGEYRAIHPDGTMHWLFSEGQGVYNAAGEAVRMVGITLDITERKQLELALQASEAKLSRILDSAIAVIVSFRVWDNYDWEYEYWSAGCEALYGFTVAEMRADKTLWLSQVLPEDQKNILMPLFETFFTQRNTVAEYRFRHKDGSIRWICSTYASEQIESNCWMVTSVNYDVTDRKHLEQELLQINAELELRVRARTLELEQAMQAAEAASRTKSAFLANMSHELRTPLNAILGFSQLLGYDQNLSSNQQEQVEIINRSGEHLLKLINDILEITKIEAGQASLTFSNLALERMLSNLKDLFRLKAEAKGIQLILHCDVAVPRYIQVDEIKLRQVLVNLLSNAIKFTQVGTVTLRVQPGERRASRAADPPSSLLLHFSVEDTGPGIDPLEQAALFRPFGSAQTGYDAQEGTGLGLPISQEFVRLMGGELNFSSSLGAGTTFYFQIPVVPITSSDLAEPPLACQVVALAPDQPDYRILVVEDNRENRQFLVQLLRSVGFEVQSAENGQRAVMNWQQWQPHLIWMDMQMPVMDGYEATRQIRALELSFGFAQPNGLEEGMDGSGEIKRGSSMIIALTASAFESERVAILAVGCNDLVCKPATAGLIFEKMAEHLGVRYLYEVPTEADPPEASDRSNEQLLAALQSMPPEWLLQIQQAIPILDEEQILQLINQIPPSEVFLAQTLKDWVHEFRFDKLIYLIDAARIDQPPS